MIANRVFAISQWIFSDVFPLISAMFSLQVRSFFILVDLIGLIWVLTKAREVNLLSN